MVVQASRINRSSVNKKSKLASKLLESEDTLHVSLSLRTDHSWHCKAVLWVGSNTWIEQRQRCWMKQKFEGWWILWNHISLNGQHKLRCSTGPHRTNDIADTYWISIMGHPGLISRWIAKHTSSLVSIIMGSKNYVKGVSLAKSIGASASILEQVCSNCIRSWFWP